MFKDTCLGGKAMKKDEDMILIKIRLMVTSVEKGDPGVLVTRLIL